MVKKYKLFLWLFFPCILIVAVSALSQALNSSTSEQKRPSSKKVEKTDVSNANAPRMILTSHSGQ